VTISGTVVGIKVFDGTTVAVLTGGALVGVVSGDMVTLNQSGIFASTNIGTGIAITATDSLTGAGAGDYSVVQPTGLSGSIVPASIMSAGSNDLVLDALNARTQVVENLIYPQLGAITQVIVASPTIALLAASADGGTTAPPGGYGGYGQPALEVSMKIGGTGTLKIENGGLRLPGNLVVGNE
jgi:hypothetical protein